MNETEKKFNLKQGCLGCIGAPFIILAELVKIPSAIDYFGKITRSLVSIHGTTPPPRERGLKEIFGKRK